MPDQVSKGVVQSRYVRLNEIQDEISWDANKALVGHEVEVLVSHGEGRKDATTGRVSGRALDGRLVHVATDGASISAGDTVRTRVTYAAPHHLVADSGLISHRLWRGADQAPVPPNAGRTQLSLVARPQV